MDAGGVARRNISFGADLWLVVVPSHRAAGEHVRERLAGLHWLRLRLWRPDEPPGERIELVRYM